MADDMIDFDPSRGDDEQSDVTGAVSRIASLNGRAVMPNGSELTRSDILARLGLNPGTSPTAWLNVIGCGSNASALLPGDLQRVAAERVGNAATVLSRLQGLQGSEGRQGGRGFDSGGTGPG